MPPSPAATGRKLPPAPGDTAPPPGQGWFQVCPPQAGLYFTKIQGFCVTDQTLQGGQKARMPVVFFVDPKIRTDPATRDIDEITLSYTFYPVESPQRSS